MAPHHDIGEATVPPPSLSNALHKFFVDGRGLVGLTTRGANVMEKVDEPWSDLFPQFVSGILSVFVRHRPEFSGEAFFLLGALTDVGLGAPYDVKTPLACGTR